MRYDLETLEVKERNLAGEQSRLATLIAQEQRTRAELVTQEESTFARLAKTYLPEISRAALGRAPAPVRESVDAILVEYETERSAVGARIAAIPTERTEYLRRQEHERKALDREQQEFDARTGKKQEALKGHGEYTAAQTELAHHEEIVAFHARRVTAARKLAADHLHLFRKDETFEYLRERGYGTDECNPTPREITMAAESGYEEDKGWYDLLIGAETAMQQDLETVTGEREKRKARVSSIEDEVEHALKLPEQRTRLATAHTAHDATTRHLTGLDAEEPAKKRRREELAKPENEYYARALTTVLGYVKNLSGDELVALARRTATPDDDACVTTIGKLASRITSSQRQEATLGTELNGIKATLHTVKRQIADEEARIRRVEEARLAAIAVASASRSHDDYSSPSHHDDGSHAVTDSIDGGNDHDVTDSI